ncbi:rhamnulokinase family protein [Nocardioides sp. SYSU D00065]|uniref:rhamnulokinase n=1 Tax=Nocardioides sp. SYSU D00065 TaxID=2817378 RepID=UPI0027DB0CF5|nr:rhamnulokinase family protein [Nocardioides sp. SYSU D00065]
MAQVRARREAGDPTLRLAAVDLGATSGRVMAATVGPGHLTLQEVHRFPNGGVPVGGSLFWDVLGIHREVLAGIAEVARSGPLDGIGIDSWAVDYGLLDRDGELLGNPYSHRDPRTRDVPELVAQTVSAQQQYAVNGLQQLPFNTVFQLVAARGTASLEAAHSLLLLPDLLGYWLTGEVGAERTNASTTGLLDVRSGEWSSDLAARLGLPWSILPPLREAGSVIGPLRAEVAAALGVADGVPVVAVGSHDTASAVVAVPATSDGFGYISSGTWSLVGLELDEPVLSEEARLADFTNEGGVDQTVRFLKNVMGLWVISECVKAWADRGTPATDLASLLAGAGTAAPLRTVVDINHPSLLGPGTPTDPMPERVVALARAAGEPVPQTPGEITRCVLDSLALAYRRHLRTAARLAGRELDVVHVVGGGSHNHLLCQLTADALGVPVLAGPAEAAALGNALVQARALGADLPDLAAMRALVRETHDVRRHDPRPGLDWDAADQRVGPPTT